MAFSDWITMSRATEAAKSAESAREAVEGLESDIQRLQREVVATKHLIEAMVLVQIGSDLPEV
jgi:hypothetical protein